MGSGKTFTRIEIAALLVGFIRENGFKDVFWGSCHYLRGKKNCHYLRDKKSC